MNKNRIIRKAGVIINIILIIALGCLFVYAAAQKIVYQTGFQISLNDSPLLREEWVPFIGWGVPIACLLAVVGIGLSFFRPSLMRLALLHYLLWLAVFTTYIILILTVAEFEPCTCIGLTERWDWEEHLMVNGALIIINLLVWLWPFRYSEANLTLFAAADEAPSQPLKNGKYVKGKEV